MRIRSIISAIVCLSLVLLLGHCSGDVTTSSQEDAATSSVDSESPGLQRTDAPAQDQATIVFFGNSLTAGYGLDEEQSFPALIQDRIDSLALEYRVVNAGLSGETSAGGLNRIDWILQQPMDIFVLELGANDALRGFDLAATRKNLQGILDKVKTTYPEVQLVVAGMEAPPNMGAAYTQEFRSIYPDLAQKYDAKLIPFLLADVGGIPSLNLADGIHPNVAGQKIVRDNVWSVIEPLLE